MVSPLDGYKLQTYTFKQQLNDGIIPWAWFDDSNIGAPVNHSLSPHLLEQLETFVQNLNVYIFYGDSVEPDDLYPACYIGAIDTIGMPYPVEFFSDEQHAAILDYYRILFHEIGHWTKHPLRLNRDQCNTFGTKAYAMEELTAELTSAFVLNQFEVTELPVLEKLKYLDKWRKVIAMFDGDIFSMTTSVLQAHKACAYLFDLQGKPS